MEYEERRSELIKLIKEKGIWNIPSYRDLGQRFGVSHEMIYKDIKLIIQNLPKEELDSVFIDLYQTDLKLLEEVRKIADSGDSKTKLSATESFIRLQDALTRLLEAWAKKPKVADRLETISRNYTINIKEPGERTIVITAGKTSEETTKTETTEEEETEDGC